MILTIRYGGKGFTPAHLAKVLGQIDFTLVDVRQKPFSRTKGWETRQLTGAIHGSHYVTCKDLEGNAVTPVALAWLKKRFYHLGAPHCVLLSKEESPGKCHRLHEICADRFPEAVHIIRDRFMSEEALEGSLKRGEELESYPLAELQEFVANCENYEECKT